jgi:hypothetical protein
VLKESNPFDVEPISISVDLYENPRLVEVDYPTSHLMKVLDLNGLILEGTFKKNITRFV